MHKNDIIEQKLDSLFINEKGNAFMTVKTDSLTDDERDYLYKRAAIGMAHLVYRNGKVENFHADSCDKATIPDSVMKEINKDVCNKCYELIVASGGADKYVSYMIVKCYAYSKFYGHDWDEPTLVPLQLSLLKNEVCMYEADGMKYGVELLYTRRDTEQSDMMVFMFANDSKDTVRVQEISDEFLQNGVEYDWEDFVNIMAEHYTICSYSVEHEDDLM